jgi:hypothetical protein
MWSMSHREKTIKWVFSQIENSESIVRLCVLPWIVKPECLTENLGCKMILPCHKIYRTHSAWIHEATIINHHEARQTLYSRFLEGVDQLHRCPSSVMSCFTDGFSRHLSTSRRLVIGRPNTPQPAKPQRRMKENHSDFHDFQKKIEKYSDYY